MITLTSAAHCQNCDWQPGSDDPETVDKAAVKHARKGHSTAVVSVPRRTP